MADRRGERIVVGVDGSPSSQAALEWALRQAERTGATVLAVTVWEWPMSYGAPTPIPSDFDPQADAARVLDDALARGGAAHPGVEVEREVAQGSAGAVLVERSAGADLLVVGSRGHGELAGFLLGSVSERCVASAHCPVLVLRS